MWLGFLLSASLAIETSFCDWLFFYASLAIETVLDCRIWSQGDQPCLVRVIFISNHSIFITYNSLFVGPTTIPIVWLDFHFQFPSLITQKIEFGLYKIRTSFYCFRIMKMELLWQSCNFAQLNGSHSFIVTIMCKALIAH